MLADNWTTITCFLILLMVMALIVFPHEVLYSRRMRPGDLVQIMGFTSFMTACVVISLILFVAYGLILHGPVAPAPPEAQGVTDKPEANSGRTALRAPNNTQKAAEHGAPSLSTRRPDSPTRQSQGGLPDQMAVSTGQP